MNKLPTKLKSEITYLPNQELKIEISKLSLKDETALIRNWRFYFNKAYRYIVSPIFLIGLVLSLTDYINQKYEPYLFLVICATNLTYIFFVNGKTSHF